ncbi:hypothetical protein EZV61_07025 [Corallincola luteus]|uniref:Mn2+-dependent serine/threonine protein kinase n=1 Tax=Corallincola luteus TaxID=1775177 RepID=A0ABY2ALW2_9GAMM|nr:hypothetical protein [Corallincola luteus]TCI03941.1 hypothetical protein EZV61_07025 [Corallincola luteus]
MKTLTQKSYAQLIEGAEALLTDANGDALVLKLLDDVIVKKIEWQKKLRAKLYPRVKRFAVKSRRLRAMGFNSAKVVDLFDCPEMKCGVVLYEMVPGEELIQKLERSDIETKRGILKKVAGYYGELNNNGVYCSPTHFRNVMIDEQLNLGLIDVHNIDFRPWRLGMDARARNFRRVFKYAKHSAQVIECGAEQFFVEYMNYCRLSDRQRNNFLQRLRKNVPIFFSGEQFVS